LSLKDRIETVETKNESQDEAIDELKRRIEELENK
jgi:polyhydroxyalkanoate synthesis regulator phasin